MQGAQFQHEGRTFTMTTIRLKPETVQTFLGPEYRFNGSKEIQSIFCREDTPSRLTVLAQIPPISTSATPFTIRVIVEKDGSAILSSSCSCPIGLKCKHINKVLQRIVDSPKSPLPERPNLKRKAETKASVYIALASKHFEYVGNGRGYGSDRHLIDGSEGFEILGMFLSKRAANRCAKERADPDEESDDEDGDGDGESDVDSANVSLFNSTNEGLADEYDEGDLTFEKVWVECRDIEDASPEFHI